MHRKKYIIWYIKDVNNFPFNITEFPSIKMTVRKFSRNIKY